MLRADPLERGGDEPGQRAGDSADAQLPVLVAQDLVELCLGELEALGDGIGVNEQGFAGRGEPRPTGAPLQQLAAHLALELGDLV